MHFHLKLELENNNVMFKLQSFEYSRSDIGLDRNF